MKEYGGSGKDSRGYNCSGANYHAFLRLGVKPPQAEAENPNERRDGESS